MKNKYIYIAMMAAALLMSGCDLTELPVTSVSKDAVFSSESGIRTYCYSFYDMFPNGTELARSDEDLVDFTSTKSINTYIQKNNFNQDHSSGWTWSDLRNINYFIDNCTDASVDEAFRNHYIAVARLFRAYFYSQRIKKFGDVPWVEHPIDYQDTATLYAGRDKRAFVMEKVWEDLEFATKNLTLDDKDATYTLVNKWVAYALEARLALREGTYLKYHKVDPGQYTTSDKWFERAETAAKYIMDNAGKSLDSDYRKLFSADSPSTKEAILVVASSADLSVFHTANVVFNNNTAYKASNMIRPFINTYLMKDGTPYTAKAGYESETFYQECQNRDGRLASTIRTPGYVRTGETKSLPKWSGYATIGYQPIKLCQDQAGLEASSASPMNTNVLYLFRYAEVLLTYAEAKAELGTLTDADWALTVGALRKRAGITGGLTTKPTTVDTYLQTNYFPDVTDPVILEIRRERGIELAFEGQRYDDLMRWHHGELLVKFPYYGINIPSLDTPLDMDNDGVADVIFYTTKAKLTAAKVTYSTLKWDEIDQAQVSTDQTSSLTQAHLTTVDGKTFYKLARNYQLENTKVWGEKQYYYPLPSSALVDNPRLGQNPGWENGASNNGD